MSGVHHEHPLGHPGDDAEIVGHPHDAHRQLFAKLADEGDDLLLDRHVEGRRRFVGDQHLGPQGEGHGDDHPLAHTPGELVGVRPRRPSGPRDADIGEHLDGARLGLLAGLPVGAQHLGDLLANAHQRVQRRHRVLVDHRHLGAADGALAGLVQRQHVAAVEEHLAGNDLRRWHGVQTHHRQHRQRLAATRLADERDGFAGADFEVDAVDDGHRPAVEVQHRSQAMNRQNRLSPFIVSDERARPVGGDVRRTMSGNPWRPGSTQPSTAGLAAPSPRRRCRVARAP